MSQYVKQIRPDSRIEIESTYNSLKACCEEYASSSLRDDLGFGNFALCCNSTYTLNDPIHNPHHPIGIIACRRINANEVEDSLVKYHPQKYHTIYKIEALYYNEYATLEGKSELIGSCIVDKNDSFIVFECRCKVVANDMDLLYSLGFVVAYEDEDKLILIRDPKRPRCRLLRKISKF